MSKLTSYMPCSTMKEVNFQEKEVLGQAQSQFSKGLVHEKP